MDYAWLRQEGIKWIEKLAGSRWTDYNTHDPGITILEALCYAITDLSYRLTFELEDLLAYPAGTSPPAPLFFTAREILTVNPLTINDYRKLLIDIDGVKNAWLEPIDSPQPALYYNTNHAKLTFNSLDLAEPVYLRGLYRVLLEKEPTYQDSALISAATRRLHQHRNLCEDFAEIRVLPIEEITIRADIEIAAQVDPHQLLAQLYRALAAHISPSLDFLSLQSLRDRGVPVEDIFAGPRLDHGFIDEGQLQQFDRKVALHISDLIHIILEIAGVKTVKHITLASDQSPTPENWVLDLNAQLTPQLKPMRAVIAAGDITFYKGQIACQIDLDTVNAAIKVLDPSLSAATDPQPFLDFPIPAGEYRELADYESIQSEFPLTYGIGAVGLPASASAQRQAQAKQLQAYLMVFDQLLANSFAQLDQVKALFSPTNPQIQTYFSQGIAHFPGGSEILKADYAQHLETLQESVSVALERKSRLLDHLIAQYGETFIDESLRFTPSGLSDFANQQKSIQQKVDFALDYRQISAGRHQAFNYTLNPNQIENFQNVSGLKRRIARLLGIEPARQFLASSAEEGFYLVEHILLRPHGGDVAGAEIRADFLSFAHTITAFQAADTADHLICTSANHGLQPGDQIKIFYSRYYSGTYSVITAETDTFGIVHEFVADDTGEWVSSQQSPDPFSFQISVILPDWPVRLQSPSFKQLFYDTLIAETPAHITLTMHWLKPAEMREFETIYALWLQHLSGNITDSSETEAATTRLINFLALGSSDIPDFPTLIGYMTIGEDFVVV